MKQRDSKWSGFVRIVPMVMTVPRTVAMFMGLMIVGLPLTRV